MHHRLVVATEQGRRQVGGGGYKPAGSAPTITFSDSGVVPEDASNVQGTNFTDPTAFVWRGGYVVADYAMGGSSSYYSPTSYAVGMPFLSSGDYSLIATTAAGSSAPFAVSGACAGSQGTANAPTLASLTPNTGAVSSTVVLDGDDFTLDMAVVFDTAGTAQEVAVTFTDQQTASFVVPAHATGAVNVRVKNTDGQSTTRLYVVV